MKLHRLFVILIVTAAGWPQDAVVEIDAGRKAPYKIPRTIYGTFLEPIGNSIYGGLWAQLLENPSFEENLWSMTAIRRKLEQNPALYRSSSLGLPLPWEPLDERQGARYEPRWNDAANSYRSLLVMALPSVETGLRQQVYLPVHRTLQYRGSLHAKHVGGPPTINLSLRRRNRPDLMLAGTEVAATGREWTKYEFSLELKSRELMVLEPADFVISVNGGGRVLLDQVFLWPADHVDGMDPEMIEMSRALRTPIVRFGGNYTSAYHWRDGVGPMDKRVSMLNLAWGMPEYNHFGTDEFLRFCKLIGADPQIALNLGTGTPEEAADWVRYVNERWGRGGLLWELGNELWGDFQTGYPTLAEIAALTRAFSVAVRAADPRARLIATGQDPDHFEKWNAAQLANPAGTFDMLATHFVVGDEKVIRRRPTPDHIALSTFAMPVELERRLRSMKQQIDSHAAWRGKAMIAFTEWLFHGPDDRTPRFHNMGGALAAAGMLNMLIRTADFVPVSDMTGLIEFGGIWKKRGRTYGVPAYWAFRMYSTADASAPVEVRTKTETYDISEGNERLPEIRDIPYLDVTAALNERGDRLTLFVINRHLHRDVEARLALAGFAPAAEARVQTLSAGSIYEANSEMEPEAVVPISSVVRAAGAEFRHRFPRSSLTTLELSARR
jgi:alpha-N-arabinofuranosidase